LVGIDEENFFVIGNGAGTKRWWPVHSYTSETGSASWEAKLGRILLPGGGEVNRIKKPRLAIGAF
jgi:hypothetical protein